MKLACWAMVSSGQSRALPKHEAIAPWRGWKSDPRLDVALVARRRKSGIQVLLAGQGQEALEATWLGCLPELGDELVVLEKGSTGGADRRLVGSLAGGTLYSGIVRGRI